MKKIRLSDTDLELFELEISPGDYTFFTRHKEAFRCMWKEQGLSFWKKFIITFRSFTNRHGAIREISNNSAKFEDFIDQAFIFVHENFVEGREGKAKSFIDDVAKLAQNRDRFKDLDSKSFAKDPFYMRDTRDLFRRFFGPPDQKASYLKVYVVSPIYLRFGGSVCRCLRRWLDAPSMEEGDESYWIPPENLTYGKEKPRSTVVMCKPCLDDCSTKYFREKLTGKRNGPIFIDYWTLGDPRFNDENNPLYAPLSNEFSDWRDSLSVEKFRDFLHYAKFKYGTESNKCQECLDLSRKREDPMDSISVADCRSEGQKKKKRKKKSKVKPTTDNMDNDIDDLVAHIEGGKQLDQMPVSTFAGAKVPDTVIPIKKDDDKFQNKLVSNKKKKIYAERTKIMEGFKSDILQANDDLPRNSRLENFNVVRTQDDVTGSSELTISIKAIKGEEGRSPRPKMTRYQNSYPLTGQMIRSHLENLPERLEWYEGDCWCACVLNYSIEEKENPTDFTIKVSGPDEDTTKRTMFKLLFYVGRRKSRPCPGWVMEDDDVVACILPDDCPDQEGLTISIIKGFHFMDRLSNDEKMTMIKTEEAEKPAEKVLMTVRGKNLEKLIQDELGKNVLKCILDAYGNNAINGNTGGTINLNAPVLDKYGKEQEQPVWNQIQKDPEKFELFFMVSKRTEIELLKRGFTTLDYSYFEKDPVNKYMPWERVFCLRCKKNRRICPCGPFRKFIELEPTKMEPVSVTKRDDLDLKLGTNMKKPILQDLLNKEFENHASLKEKERQRFQQLKANLQSVPEDDEKAKEEMRDFIVTVLKRRKTDGELSPQKEDKERPKRVLLFGSGLSTDGVTRVSQVKRMDEDVKKYETQKINNANNKKDRACRTDGNEKSRIREGRNTGAVSKLEPKLNINGTGEKQKGNVVQMAVRQKEVQEKKADDKNAKYKEKSPKVEAVGLENIDNEDENEDWTSTDEESSDEKKEDVQPLETKSKEQNILDDSDDCLTTQAVEKENDKQTTSAEEGEMKSMEQSPIPGPEVEVNRDDIERSKNEPSLLEEEKDQIRKSKDDENEQVVLKDQGSKLNEKGQMDTEVDKEPVITHENQSDNPEEEESLTLKEEGKPTSLEQEEVIVNNQEDQGTKLNGEGQMDTEVDKEPVITDVNQSANPEEEESLIKEEGKPTSLEQEEVIVNNQEDEGTKLNGEGQMGIGVERGPVITDEKQSANPEEGESLIKEEGKPTSLKQDEVIVNNQNNSFLTKESHSSTTDQDRSTNTVEKEAVAADQEKSVITEDLSAEDKGTQTTAEKNGSFEENVDKSITSLMEQNSTQTDQDRKTQDEFINQREILTNKIDEESSTTEPIIEKKEKIVGVILKCCSFCNTEEPAPKTYKKCLKCKQEGIISARYYCGKKCQTSDWKLRHKGEHKENLLD
ncbi:uncharacterized protein LOC133195863 [Saccostrea echinata]|uniref:uncharacterized protein LOC133195863 n=1 Tax=Saccostrea echinata TaxID=191078 RepID=UPI002A826013|nr:uncharacterized protein LOC133195863 [Saccostrea echinata]